MNVKKHSAAALGEYLDRHPQWETTEVRIKIEQQSALTREKLEELVRRLIEEKMGSLPTTPEESVPSLQEDMGQELSMMLENLKLFL